LSNRLDGPAIAERAFAGVIGDAPSHYSKSPALWNAAFKHLHLNAVYLPFDVEIARLGDLLHSLKNCDTFLGANVTVPHKVRIMELLDSIDPVARRIQAVNTIVRSQDGKLIGYNTDGAGFVDSILRRQPDRSERFIASLEGMNVLLLGAGGAARAVAFHVADELQDGKLIICNRTAKQASSLAADIQKSGRNAQAITEEELPKWAPSVGLIVNCTIKGQGGMRLPEGTAILLEPYSALAPAHPLAWAAMATDRLGAERNRQKVARDDIESNNRASMKIAESVPRHVRFYDLIYHPEETVFLRHAKLTGHPTMNGKAMIINQAVIAFCTRICNAQLTARGLDTPNTYNEILDVMYSAW
jgi:shikimate dehydrogenase